MMDRIEIERVIPHRAPFLWIDSVEELEPGVRCVAHKRVDPAEPAFRGHFPNRPVLPGVYLIEAVAQTAGVMLGAGAPPGPDATPLLAAVNRFKFLKPVGPGDNLRIVTTVLTEAGRLVCVTGTITVNGAIVAGGELTVQSG
jgi:3-hydroxyacyl-[acyl-carrier-protein] dehydratase